MIAETQRQNQEHGLIFNIQKFSLHDGTGIRTLVFLKGCPLACEWCSNPEGQGDSAELVFTRALCIGTDECERCLRVCGPRAISCGSDGKVEVDRLACDNCGECTSACPSKALEMSGRLMCVDDVIREVEEDGSFYARSGGGLTVSGGEPLSQAEFVKQLLITARRRGLNTAIETSGLCSWKSLEEVAPHADQIFYDIKCIDLERHTQETGVSNQRILENLAKFRRRFPETPVVVRTPVIPGVNDTEQEIQAIVDSINEAGGASAYELLPYHGFGEPKYRKLGRSYRLSHVEPPSEARMAALRAISAQVAPLEPSEGGEGAP
jgi:pyruvate formate lyase activating enzyme